MSGQKVQPAENLADAVLADVAVVRELAVEIARSFGGDEHRRARQALVVLVGQLDAVIRAAGERVDGPTAAPDAFSDTPPQHWPAVEPGHNTGDVSRERRMRHNRGRHAAGGPR